MRKIRGWITNLADGLGPDPGSVIVHAWVTPPEGGDRQELNEATHDLGKLNVEHLRLGSGSNTRAFANGHFGWDMELSPGPIKTEIEATLPEPAQHRNRFPDESAQVGKAFHSDLERLGWTAGRDCLVWGAIEGVTPPTPADWKAGDPLVTSGFGDWSVDISTAAANPGRVALRRGIGFLGGVVFSIEAGDLLVPLLSDPAAPANGPGTDRWDLLVLDIDVDPTSATYGKQTITIQQGGSTIPTLGPLAGHRRMAIHALKMAAGASVYSGATDLRQWNRPPSTSVPGFSPSTVRYYSSITQQQVGITRIASMLNTTAGDDEILLPLDTAWTGTAIFIGNIAQWSTGSELFVQASTEGRATQAGTKIDGTDYITNPTPEGYARVLPMTGSASPGWWGHTTVPFPVRRIPSSAEGRTWHRLRFAVHHWTRSGGLYVTYPSLAVNLWPVP